jgi:hypothetical protein
VPHRQEQPHETASVEHWARQPHNHKSEYEAPVELSAADEALIASRSLIAIWPLPPC